MIPLLDTLYELIEVAEESAREEDDVELMEFLLRLRVFIKKASC